MSEPSDPVRIVEYEGLDIVALQAAINQIQAQVNKLNFDGTKLKTDATLTAGTINILETHITDPNTDTPVDVESDGINNAMVVKQNSQPLPTGAATSAKQDTLLTELQLKANLTDTQPIEMVLHQYTGNLNALDAVLEINADNYPIGTVVFQISGTWKGKIIIEGAVDGTFNNLSIVQPGGTISFAGINNDNQNGVYRVLLPSNYTHLHFKMSAYTSGTAVIVADTSSLVSTPFVWQLNAANLQMTSTMVAADRVVLDALLTELQKKADVTETQPISMAAVPTGVNLVDPSNPTEAWGEKGVRVLIGATDVISNLPVFVDYDHHQVHEGETFRYGNYSSALANNATKDIRFVVPSITVPAGIATASRMPHFRWEVISSAGGVAILYEGTTFSGNGNQRTPIALERNGSYTSQLTVWEDPSVNVLGTPIWTGLLLAGNPKAGGIDKPENEFVLKNNTSYHMRFTSAGASNQVLLRYVWYEDLGV